MSEKIHEIKYMCEKINFLNSDFGCNLCKIKLIKSVETHLCSVRHTANLKRLVRQREKEAEERWNRQWEEKK